MAARSVKPVTGRGDRVLPGVFRLRLPLPWPGVPHGNAWALRHDGGLVLVDAGYFGDELAALETALCQVGHRIEEVRLIVCTHAHSDHCGNAAAIAERTGCEVWMHPDRAHMTLAAEDPEAATQRRRELSLRAGVPAAALDQWLAERAALPSGIAQPLTVARELLPGVTVPSDIGELEVIETPGHAPSHVCLYARDRRILFSGDHVLGRVSLFFEPGYSPDPVGEYLESLDRVEAVGARLCLAGHARPFTDVSGHVGAHRAAVHAALESTLAVLRERPRSALGVARTLGGNAFDGPGTVWLLSQALCHLDHLAATGRAWCETNLDTGVSRFGIVP